MNNASASGTSDAAPSTSAVVPERVSNRLQKVYKTVYGEFWHYEDPARRRSSYLRTVCGRRLGRWHLRPAQSATTVPATAVCASCRRKVAA
jgi:hypothetical protein